jgi:glucokinase
MAVIALDLGGTKLAGAILDAEGEILHKTVAALEQRQGAAVGELVKTHLRTLYRFARQREVPVEAIGVSVPGISYFKTGRVWAPNISGWDDYPLRDEIAASIEDKRLRVTIDSDRACYILGETWRGAAQGCKDAIFLAVGTGIGAGIMVDGKVLHGAHDIGGAIGWMALGRPFLERYRACGCFEHYASGEGIAKAAQEYLAAEESYSGVLRGKRRITGRDVFEAHQTHDLIAVKVLNQAVEFWGMAVANLVSLFDPEKIIFGGGVFGPGLHFLDAILAEAKQWAQPIAIEQVKLEASMLGGDAGLYGAAYLALRPVDHKQGSNL